MSCGQVKPEVFIVPLGTGNDLARVLGLGKGYSSDVNVRDLLDMMKTARVVLLDRYVITGQTLVLNHVTPTVLLLLWHAPIEMQSATCRCQSREWAEYVSCFIQGEVIGFQVLLDSLHPCSTMASWWTPPVLQGKLLRSSWHLFRLARVQTVACSEQVCLEMFFNNTKLIFWCPVLPDAYTLQL